MNGLLTETSRIFLAFARKNIFLSLVIVAILVGRLLLKKLPKRYSYFLWAGLGVRALFDIGVHIKFPKFRASQAESGIAETIGRAVEQGQKYIFEFAAPERTVTAARASLTARDILPAILFGIWVTGVLLMLVYGIFNYVKVKKATAVSFKEESGLYRCDYIDSPMAFGFIRPRVYVPSDCDISAMSFVIEHEKTHIRRGDVYFKLLAFLILCAYWVNPLAWVAFKLFNLDMELSCDEAVIRRAGLEKKEEYSRWLLYYSTEERFVSLAPTAFGETDTKRRVKNIMKLKKKGIIATIAGVVITGAVIAACFILLPQKSMAEGDVSENVNDSAEIKALTVAEDSKTVNVITDTEQATVTETPAETETIVGSITYDTVTEDVSSDDTGEAEVITWTSPFAVTAEYFVTSRFGNKSKNADGESLFHGATDFAAPLGTELLAACDGTVETAGWDGERGYAVTIKVNDDILYRYAHLDEIKVKEGDTVKAGDVVATVGSSGASTGPHLHLELKIDGKYVDPLKYIQIDEDTRETSAE
ncbi:MAG: peptidoglycan DD-metalloendopeptidase family protein [Lachnospiraceae bacterium]|nr:peptidoglycan DD-metalloendopeptidase family protein [Lachnospiraceae bacterium]